MKLKQLTVLTTVAETGSLQSAALALNVSQPAVSKAIRELEESVGGELLRRGAAGVTPTDLGKTVLFHARGLLAGVARAHQDIQQFCGEYAPQVSVVVTPVTGVLTAFADCIAALRREIPSVRLRVIELRPRELNERLREGVIDLAITSQSPPPENHFEIVKLGNRESLVAVRKQHPAAEARSLEQFAKFEWITLDAADDKQAPLRALFESRGLPLPQDLLECGSIRLALLLLERRDSVMLLSEESSKIAALRARLRFITLDGGSPHREIYLLRRRDMVMSHAASTLYRIASEHLTR